MRTLTWTKILLLASLSIILCSCDGRGELEPQLNKEPQLDKEPQPNEEPQPNIKPQLDVEANLKKELKLSEQAPNLRLNEIQIIGSHNSYKQAIDTKLFERIAKVQPKLAESLDYSHIGLVEQLNLGLRKIELDIFYDPVGGMFEDPLGIRLTPSASDFSAEGLREPGFKVLHIQDIDFRSHCATLVACLDLIKQWSDQNPDHYPIFVTLNTKQGTIDLPGFVKPVSFDARALNLVDKKLREVLKDKLYTPDQFRAGASDLPAAVARGWPLIRDVRGRVIVVLDEGVQMIERYVQDHHALLGRAMFVNAQVGSPESAIFIINDPIGEFSQIQSLVKAGFIVRTRSDAATVEARSGETLRRQQAFDSGAQIISTDYYHANSQFEVKFDVQFSDGAYIRCNPITGSTHCK